jgi:hypothetical protein
MSMCMCMFMCMCMYMSMCMFFMPKVLFYIFSALNGPQKLSPFPRNSIILSVAS